MKNLLQKDKKKRRLFFKEEKLRAALKYLCSSRFLSLRNRWVLHFEFEKISVQSNFVQLRNRCVSTFRSRSILRSFRLSRILFRNFARSGKIYGVSKESW